MTTTLEPVSVALKFGFIAVLYLFLLWVSRSALRDLRIARPDRFSAPPLDGTGLHSASTRARLGADEGRRRGSSSSARPGTLRG